MLKQLLILSVCAIYIIAADYQPTTYTYKTVGDLDIQLDVYIPNVTLYDKYPVILAIHGGGYMVGSVNNAYSIQERNEMLNRGWVVIPIDYRLSPDALLPDIIQDVQDAYQWIRTQLVNIIPINPDAIAVWGDSAGGGLTAISGYKLTPRPKALVVFYPYCTNFTDKYAYDPSTPVSDALVAQANALRQPLAIYDSVPNDPRWALFAAALKQGKAGWVLVTANPDEPVDNVMAMLQQYSVVNYIDSEYPPTYLIHGLADDTVPFSQSVEMAKVLRSQNITYQIDLVPGANHAFDLGGVTSQMWQEHIVPIFEFTEQYLTTGANASKIITQISI